ncbi:DUF1992 domain-containing protein [uncultured Jatrophihabitans sp.]|uniref:DnaJ family domain-containing protein n=1 Tax=uncultured Jatrophihabitans sp. TaxID=1610747 RepID=UPI0035C96F6E
MTTRKPSSRSVPNWVEMQIRNAEHSGAFENLPGAGKPIPGLGQPQHELAWVADYLRRENTDITTVLPPALAVAKEVETLPDRLVRERSETRVRELVAELNARIDAEHATPQDGLPFRVKRVPVEPTVEQWRAHRAALVEVRAAAAVAEVSTASTRRWPGRRRRRNSGPAPE